MMELIIDREFAEIFPSLPNREFELLEESIQREGCRDDLIIWNGIIIDGHNRYKICREHNIPFKCREMSFPDREHAKLWMITNQLSRRNLTVFQRCMLILPMEEEFKKEAEERRREKISEYRKNGEMPQNSAVSKETRDMLAELVRTSHDTIDKVKYILKNADDELKDRLARGDIKINRAFNELKEKAMKESGSDTSERKAAGAMGKYKYTAYDNDEINDEDEYEEDDEFSDEDDANYSGVKCNTISDDWLPRACSTDGEKAEEPPIEYIGGFKPVSHQEPLEFFPHEPERNPGPFYYVKDYTRSALKNMIKEIRAAIYQLSDEDADKGGEILSMLEQAYNEARTIIEGEIKLHSSHKN